MKLNQKNMFERVFGWTFAATGGFILLVWIALTVLIDRFSGEKLPVYVPVALVLMALIFGSVGFIFMRNGSKARKKQKRLMQDGVSYDAEITETYYKSAYQVNGRSPLVVECRYVNRYGERYLVKTGNLWPQMPVDVNAIRATVFVNPEDPKDYYVEIISEDPYWEGTHDLR